MIQPQIYRYAGYRFELPPNATLLSLDGHRGIYSINTTAGMVTLKACRKCKRLLPTPDFYQRKSPCKTCHMAQVKRWQKNNPACVKSYKKRHNKKYYANNNPRKPHIQSPTP